MVLPFGLVAQVKVVDSASLAGVSPGWMNGQSVPILGARLFSEAMHTLALRHLCVPSVCPCNVNPGLINPWLINRGGVPFLLVGIQTFFGGVFTPEQCGAGLLRSWVIHHWREHPP